MTGITASEATESIEIDPLLDGDVVRQRTLKNRISCSGVGLHSGDEISITIAPAEAGTGILFRRTDVTDRDADIPATWDRVTDTRLCTSIGNDAGVGVGTIEHLMAALAGCGVDNTVIEIDGPEVPIMDGSSEPFVFLLKSAGLVEQDAARRIIRIDKPITVEAGESRAVLEPGPCLTLDLQIDFDSSAVARQSLSVGLVNGSFCRELASARTFGFLHEVEQMRAAGLALGGSLDNAIVVDDGVVMNDGGLRFEDEFVRHKMLDAFGDLYLAGAAIVGRLRGHRTGHALNNALLKALFASPDSWSFDVMRGAEVKTAVDGGIKAQPMPVAEVA